MSTTSVPSTATASPTSVLVVGATGKQGGAVVRALLAGEAANGLTILALTRDASAAPAQALAASASPPGRVQLVQGSAAAPAAVFAGLPAGSVAAVFIVTTTPGDEQQGKGLVDAAVAHGVRHIVFSGVDRGGSERSWTNLTDIQHFADKARVELYLRDRAAASPGTFTWTILRPVAFMDNARPGAFGPLFLRMWAIAVRPSHRVQLVAASDIGRWAAASIVGSLSYGAASPYAGRAISLAGDELSLDEVRAAFRRVVGREPPQTWWILGRLLLWLVGDLGSMFAIFDAGGNGADVAALRAEPPGTVSFETWLRTESGYTKEGE